MVRVDSCDSTLKKETSMKNSLACATLCALLAAGGGDAAASTWTFTISHLCGGCSISPGDFLYGEFTGTDVDHNGSITLSELSELQLGPIQFFPDWASGPGEPPSRGSTSSFSYMMSTGSLEFNAGANYYRDAINVVTGNFIAMAGPDVLNGTFRWTPETTIQVSEVGVSEVPEPSVAYLFVGGLIATLGMVRSLQRKGRAS
jgi:hypothetical protein